MQYTPLMTDAQERWSTTGKNTVWECEVDEGNAELGMGEQFQQWDTAHPRTKEYKSL